MTTTAKTPQEQKGRVRAMEKRTALRPPGRPVPGRQLLMTLGALWIGIVVACALSACWVPLVQAERWAGYGGTVLCYIVVVISRAPQIYRFGCWLNRNFGDLEGTSPR